MLDIYGRLIAEAIFGLMEEARVGAPRRPKPMETRPAPKTEASRTSADLRAEPCRS